MWNLPAIWRGAAAYQQRYYTMRRFDYRLETSFTPMLMALIIFFPPLSREIYYQVGKRHSQSNTAHIYRLSDTVTYIYTN